jgi:hypothetical protein
MRRAAFLGVAAALLVGRAADGDVLKLSPRGELVGTVEEVTFNAKGVKSAFPIDEVSAIQLSRDGKDTLELEGGIELSGKLVSVSLRIMEGVRAVAREKLEAITFDADTTVEALKAKAAEEAEEAAREEDLTDEQKEALQKNKELFKAYMTKVEEKKQEGMDGVKNRHMKRVKKLVDEIVALEKSIENKRRRRRQAASRGGSYRSTDDYDRVRRNDGLERDERELAKKRRDASKLKKAIRKEEKKVAEEAEMIEKRVRHVAKENRQKIFDGEVLTEEQMTARYEAAMALKGPDDKEGKDSKK